MRDFGVEVKHTLPETQTSTRAFTVPFGASFMGRDNYQIEGDWSNAAIWMVAAGMTGKTNYDYRHEQNSVQADRRIMQVMIDAGCDVVWDGMNVTVTGRASSQFMQTSSKCRICFLLWQPPASLYFW